MSPWLVAMAKGWTIVGKDLISEVTCAAAYEWKAGPTGYPIHI